MKRKIEAMHEAYGTHPDLCKNCENFFVIRSRSGRNYFKCIAYGYTNAESTDWRAKWTACGLFNQPIRPAEFVTMLERLKHAKRQKPDGPVEGQIEMEGLE